MVDLKKLEKMVDETLAKETKESWDKFLTGKQLMEELGDKLCEYCPFTKGHEGANRLPHICEGDWCEGALENYLVEQQEYPQEDV